jgi:hypothetical protein
VKKEREGGVKKLEEKRCPFPAKPNKRKKGHQLEEGEMRKERNENQTRS